MLGALDARPARRDRVGFLLIHLGARLLGSAESQCDRERPSDRCRSLPYHTRRRLAGHREFVFCPCRYGFSRCLSGLAFLLNPLALPISLEYSSGATELARSGTASKQACADGLATEQTAGSLRARKPRPLDAKALSFSG